MKQHTGWISTLKNLLRDERGAVLLTFTVYLPVVVGFFTLAVDYSYVLRTKNTLQVTAESAALAAASYLPDVAGTATCPVAQLYANTNMPTGSYGNVGNVVSTCSDVVVGMWSATCAAGTKCFVPAATTACGIQCNAVQVTTRMTAANNNSLALVFAPMIGIPSFNVTATAIAVYGNDPAALPWYISVVQDVSWSFRDEIDDAKAAAQALRTCMFDNASNGSKMGISVFGRSAVDYQPSVQVSTNNPALTTAISNINTSGNNPMPNNIGTDIAGGINTGTSQSCPSCTPGSTPTTFKPAIVILTDGLPTALNGNYCGAPSLQQCRNQACRTCINTASQNAVTAANEAGDKGTDIYAIYFCRGSCDDGPNPAAATWLSGLVKGNGTFMKTPTAEQMKDLMVTNVCKPAHTMRLVW